MFLWSSTGQCFLVISRVFTAFQATLGRYMAFRRATSFDPRRAEKEATGYWLTYELK